MGFSEDVLSTIRHEGLVPEGSTVVCGLSGGADSVALVLAMRDCAPQLGCRVVAAHLDHALRDGSEEDARFCRRLSSDLELPLREERVDWKARGGRPDGNVEARARAVRYEFLTRLAAEQGGIVAVGHTADDRAETFLAQLVRGAGARGLSLPRLRRGDGVIRPLLDRSRAAVLAFLTERGVSWRTDPTNLDGSNLRSRIRRDVLPLLLRENPELVRTVGRTAEQLAGVDELLNDAAEQALRDLQGGHTAPSASREFCLDALRGRAYHRAVLSSVLRNAARRAGNGEIPGFDSLERLARAWKAGQTLVLDLPGGVRVSVGTDRVSIAPGAVRPTSRREREVPIPGTVLWSAGERETNRSPVHLIVQTAAPPPDPGSSSGPDRAWIDAERVARPLRVRSRLPGDRYRPLGLDGSAKVQDLFVDRKIPAGDREAMPILADEEGILWIPGFRVDHRARITESTKTALRLEVRSSPPGSGGSRS